MHSYQRNPTFCRTIPLIITALALLFWLFGNLGPALADRRSPGPPVGRGTEIGMVTRPGELRLLADGAYYDSLVSHIGQAKQRIDMVMFLFKTTGSPKNRSALLVKELIKARGRGVAVNVCLDLSNHDQDVNRENRKTAEALRFAGITVTFDRPDTTTHAKLVVIDYRYVFLGSHNLTHAALAHNHESSLLVDSPPLAAELLQYMKTLGD